ncbi:MAG: tetratricopeptide repeat protein [Pseudomonadota bacterium]
MKVRAGLTLVLFSLVLAVLACAPKVTVERRAPGPGPWPDFQTLVVGQISGPDGPAVVQGLSLDLDLQPGLAVVEKDRAEIILTGSVTVTITDERGHDLLKAVKKTGGRTKVTAKDPFVGQEFTVNKPGTTNVAEPAPYVQRRAELKLEYLLTSQDRSASNPQSVTVSSVRKYGGVNQGLPDGPGLQDLPSRKKTLDELIKLLAMKLAERLVPSPVRFKLALDTGEGLFGQANIKRGVKLALAGQWEEAVKIWRLVLEEDPDNPAAYYDLGVAYERLDGLQNLKAALKMYGDATARGNNPLYRQALTRVTVAVRKLEQDQDQER